MHTISQGPRAQAGDRQEQWPGAAGRLRGGGRGRGDTVCDIQGFPKVYFTHLFDHSGRQETPLHLLPPTHVAAPPSLCLSGWALPHAATAPWMQHIRAGVAAAHLGTTTHPQDSQAPWGRGHSPVNSSVTTQCKIWTTAQKQGELEIGKTSLLARLIVKPETVSTGFV